MRLRSWWLPLVPAGVLASVHPSAAQNAAALFAAHCAPCHEAAGDSRAPTRDILKQLAPEQILQVLEKGAMSAQGAERSRAERRALAEYLSGKPFGTQPISPIAKTAFCGTPGVPLRDAAAGPVWNGWGVTLANTRYQSASMAGLTADAVPRLALKWAFGFPGAASASAQPVVFGGRVYVSSWEGDVYALDAETGCIRWAIETEAGVRSAISIGPGEGGRYVAYFGDLAANAYAVDAESGRVLWKSELDDYPLARITGSPALHGGRLFVPVSSREESEVADAGYACCRFRGSVVAVDTATGRTLWKTYTIPVEPRPTVQSRAGRQLWGPSGVAVWTAPTIDAKRNVLYVGTGNDYSSPSTAMSDAIVALDLTSGAVRWVRQITANDIWNLNCRAVDRDAALCPDGEAPDFDFAASPALVTLKDGRELLIAGNKSAVVFALDPDRRGDIIWQQRIGKGGTQGGILWGPAIDGDNVYAALSDFARLEGRTPNPDAGGGIAAVELTGGRVVWQAPPVPCGDRRPCSPAQAAAVTAVPGVVFSGSVDGHLRAYSTRDGSILWDYDTVRDYTTVNGVSARGGSINNGGPAVAGGMLFTNSGYSHHSGVLAGNVLLAFAPTR